MNVQLPTLKQEALACLQNLDESVDMDEMMYRLHLVNKLHLSRAAIARGDMLNHEALKQEIAAW
ncbi:MAG: hypothetical protein V4650_11215 [Pseudomonadota bacterium]